MIKFLFFIFYIKVILYYNIEKENNNNGDKDEIFSDEPKIFDSELIVGGNRNKVNFIVNQR